MSAEGGTVRASAASERPSSAARAPTRTEREGHREAARVAAAFVAGLLFAVGLAVSGMTDPAKVLGFLDVAGDWDPSLMLVMAGAVGAHFFAARWAKTARSPILGGHFDVPTETPVDRRLIVGAALFGLGWGIAGYCPGPALVGAVGLSPRTWLFLLSMITAISLVRLDFRRGAGTRLQRS